jgi:hypothetical protein
MYTIQREKPINLLILILISYDLITHHKKGLIHFVVSCLSARFNQTFLQMTYFSSLCLNILIIIPYQHNLTIYYLYVTEHYRFCPKLSSI